MAFVRSISGIRATLDTDLTPSIIYRYTLGLIKALNPTRIAIGRDGRPSGLWIEKIIADTAASSGVEFELFGIVPTPTVQLIVEKHDFDAGIVITASHNPAEWNGLKFLGHDGVFLDEEANQKIWEIVDSTHGEFDAEKFSTKTKLNSLNPLQFHIKSIIDNSFISNALDRIRKKRFRVVVDAVNASGSLIVPELLKTLGCEVVPLFCDSSGVFPHTPEPLPENLVDLCREVKQQNADLGIAVDPDADRLVIVDNNGNCIGEEKTIALAVMALLENVENPNKQSVVVNLSTSSMAEWATELYGANLLRSPVGEINVVNKMRRSGAIIGGEGSGGVILPSVHYGRDSLVGIALILSLLAAKSTSMSELSAGFPNYTMQKLKFEFKGDFDILKTRIIEILNPKKVNLEDGIRCDFDSMWLHIRKSNTEPIIRLIYETFDHDDGNIITSVAEIIDQTK